MKRLLFFDLDGTLLDTLADLHAAVNAALQAYGYPLIDHHQAEQYIGNGTHVFLEKACGGNFPPELAAYYKQYYSTHLLVHTTAYPGMVKLIEDLRDDYVLILNTNKYQQAAEFLTEHFFPGAFQEILGDGRFARKPDPQAVHAMLEQYGCTKEQALFIGDSSVDRETARKAGIDVCITAWGYGKPRGTTTVHALRQLLVSNKSRNGNIKKTEK